MSSTYSRSPRVHRGMVLLTTVVMLAIAVILLSQLATRSLSNASNAIEKERRIRAAWARNTLRDHFLNRQRQTLDGDRSSHEEHRLRLGGETWLIRLSDESGKASLPALASRYNDADLRLTAATLVAPDSRYARLKTGLDSSQSSRWENWFEQPRSTNTRLKFPLNVSKTLTLWGDGRTNVFKADDHVLTTLWKKVFGTGTPDQLRTLRSAKRSVDLQTLASLLDLRESERALFNQWFTTKSSCTGLWIRCESRPSLAVTQHVEWSGGGGKERRAYEY